MEVAAALDSIKQEGPIDKNGKSTWKAFDWSRQCQVVAVMVYATAGMRIAEQKNRDESRKLWANLKQKLKKKLGTPYMLMPGL